MVTTAQLFSNPFNKDAAHHTPLGLNVVYGRPKGTEDAKKTSGVTYDAGFTEDDDTTANKSTPTSAARGRLRNCGAIIVGRSAQGRKYHWLVATSDSSHRTVWQGASNGGGTGDGLNVGANPPGFVCKLPSGQTKPPEPPNDGDNEVLAYPNDGVEGESSQADVFAQFCWTGKGPDATAGRHSARARDSYPLNGRDVRDSWSSTSVNWGPGAIDWRHPGGHLRKQDFANTAIGHLLNATACRHSHEGISKTNPWSPTNQGAQPEAHIISRRIAYPAWERDRPLFDTADYVAKGQGSVPSDNQGDLPYGTIIAIHQRYANIRDSSDTSPVVWHGVTIKANFSANQKKLFDNCMYWGICLCDGQGQTTNAAKTLGRIQLRIDHEMGADTALCNEVDEFFALMLPYFWPVYSRRDHLVQTAANNHWRHTDGLIYVGGGGPLSATKSINTAFDAGTTPPITPTTSFQYRITDSALRTASATVELTLDDSITVPVANNDTVAVTFNTAKLINVKENDTPTTVTVDRISNAPNKGSAVIQSDGQVLYTPNVGAVGADSFKYVIKLGLFEAEGTVSLTISSGAPTNRYVYKFKPAAGFIPTADANVVVWNIPTAGGDIGTAKGSESKVLLMVAPSGSITGTVTATGLKYKGVFLIGATCRPKGGTAFTSPGGASLKGKPMFVISFANDITVRPVLFLANIDYDPTDPGATTPDRCWWGNFLSGYTEVFGNNQSAWADIYLQKVWMPVGSYGFVAGTDGTPRSYMFTSAAGAFANFYASEIDAAWSDEQFLFKNLNNKAPFADGRARFYKVMTRLMPASTTIYGGPGDLRTDRCFVQNVGVQSGNKLTAGEYYAVDFDTCFGSKGGATLDLSVDGYIYTRSPAGGVSVSGNRATMPTYINAARANPAWSGFVDFQEPTTSVVDKAELGSANRITTAADLRSALG